MNVRPGCMSNQKDLNYTMRAILVDWLSEVTFTLSSHMETLHLSVHLIDKYLARVKDVKRDKEFQRLGITCLWIASKFHDVHFLDGDKDCAYHCDDGCTKQDILDWEGKILNTLKFELSYPTSFYFFEMYFNISKPHMSFSNKEKIYKFGHYIMCLALQWDFMNKHTPSLIAFSAIAFARLQFDVKPMFVYALEEEVGFYDVALSMECVQDLHKVQKGFYTSPTFALMAVQDHFAQDKLDNVSKVKMLSDSSLWTTKQLEIGCATTQEVRKRQRVEAVVQDTARIV